MANAAIAHVNLADDDDVATVTVPGALSSAPAANLLNPHVGVKCRVNATAAYVLTDLGSSVSLDTLMLAGVSGTDPDFRVRLSSVDPTGAAGDVYDSGAISGLPYFDPAYGLFVHLQASPLSARYVRIDQSEGAVAYTEWGRLFIGLRNAFGINFQTPWRRTAVRGSVDTAGLNSGTFVDLRQGYWRVNAPFGFLSETERNDFIEAIGVAIVNSGHRDMLWIADPDSDNLSRDCIWGYLDGDAPSLSQDINVVPPVFSAEFAVRQRR